MHYCTSKVTLLFCDIVNGFIIIKVTLLFRDIVNGFVILSHLELKSSETSFSMVKSVKPDALAHSSNCEIK